MAVAYRSISQITALGESTWELPQVNREIWSTRTIPDEFWDSGDIEFSSSGQKNIARIFDGPISYIGIRFDHAGIELIVDQFSERARSQPKLEISRAPPPITPLSGQTSARPKPPVVQPGTRAGPKHIEPAQPRAPAAHADALPRPRANPVTDREIKAWYRALTKTEKTFGVTTLWARAKADHPGRHLPRKLVEQFGARRGAGHRAKV